MKDKLEKCKRLIIYTLKLRKNDSIYYQEFLEIYKKSQEILGQEGIFLNEKDFAEKILELTLLSYKAIKYAKGSAKILKNYQVDSQKIENIRKKLICQERLHKGQQLTYDMIRKFFENEQYFLPLEEKEYFEKMLDITNFRLRNIKSKPDKAKTSILENEEVSDEEIRSFKEKLLKEEKLHSGDTLTYEQCRNLFEKHHIRISEIDFMDKILDITNKAYTEIRYNPQKRVRILKKTTLNKELILKIRRYIIWKEKLYKKQEKIYDEIKAIFDKYYTVLSEIEFAEKMLDITEASLRTVKSNGNKAVILKDLEIDENTISKFRKKLIQKENLHIGEGITYSQFKRIYNENYFPLNEKEFAEKMLDITSKVYDNLKSTNNTKKKAIILQNEKISPDEIKALQQGILKELQIGEWIDIDCLREIYKKYPIRLLERDYAEQILEIPKSKLHDMRGKRKIKARIFLGLLEKYGTEISKSLDSNGYYLGYRIDLEEFEKIYEKFGKQGTRRTFAEVIGVDIRNFTKRLKTTNFKQKNKKSKR